MLSTVLRLFSSMKSHNQCLERVSLTPVKSVSVALLTTSDFALLQGSWHFKGFPEEEEANGNGIRFRGFIQQQQQSSKLPQEQQQQQQSQSFSPSTPPPTSVDYRTTKRRKGIAHRAPMAGLIIEY
ncbi:hypothetical protein CXB51_018924 [Gossypium anomalum]|uniref:Uncharacterized protein n=1 Tax=Gossypium anomalum TaxID=47600 RepID=A0A8J6CZC4_9ROSI|nr:hypothetical protein CXB51_018924 [Gossypium anomalum]